MQPIDPTKSPKVQSPALNHLGLWVDNIEKAVEHLTAQGIQFTPGGIRKGAGKRSSDQLILLLITSFSLICCSWLQCYFHSS